MKRQSKAFGVKLPRLKTLKKIVQNAPTGLKTCKILFVVAESANSKGLTFLSTPEILGYRPMNVKIAFGAAALALALVACGGKKEEAAPAPAAAAPAADQAAPAAAPAAGEAEKAPAAGEAEKAAPKQ